MAEILIFKTSTLDSRYVNISGDTMTGDLGFSGTDHAGIVLNSLTTTQRDVLTAAAGMVIYNTTTNQIEAYANGAWAAVGDTTTAKRYAFMMS